MKKLAVTIFALCNASLAFAGGILTNTNQSARFARLMALEASTNVDAAFYNPAGLVKLNNGFHFSFSNQSAFQTREITTTFAPFKFNGGSESKFYKGTASAPIIPSLQAAYKKDKWVLSGNLCVIGGGGKATFNEGLPSFEAPVATLPLVLNGLGMPTTAYSVDAYMTGSSFIYGAQMGASYAITDMFSAYGGFRLNIVNNAYEGYLRNVKINPTHPLLNPNGDMMLATAFFKAAGKNDIAESVADKEIDSKQSGWGIAPIVGFHFNYEKLNIGMKYEFKAALNIENKTIFGKDAGLEQFKDGVNTAHDIPALFTVGASYKIFPKLTASVGYHHYFDKQAKMANDKQKTLTGGTHEYLAGLEYQINDMFLVSGGTQFTNYGVSDEFQRDLSFSVSSYAIGFGGAANVAKNVQINVGYFWSTYQDYTKELASYGNTGLPGKDVFTRTNKVFAAGVEFSF